MREKDKPPFWNPISTKEKIDAISKHVYSTQFYSNKHSKLRKWLIVKLIKFQLRFKK